MIVNEFTCEDCGDNVVQFGTATPGTTICSTCQWIRQLPNEHDRQRARDFLDRHPRNGGSR